MHLLRGLSLLVLLLGALGAGEAQADKWEAAIAAFEASDAKAFPAPGGNVFVGSSSITGWSTLAKDLAPAPVIKRGFGGSQLGDTLRYAGRIIIPYKPKRVFVYAGDNDLAAKRTPEAVAADFAALVATIRASLPDTAIYFIAVKPSPKRVALLAAGARTNALVAEFAATQQRVALVDIATPMLDAAGQPRPELFKEDMLHMNPEGYAIWIAALKPLLAD